MIWKLCDNALVALFLFGFLHRERTKLGPNFYLKRHSFPVINQSYLKATSTIYEAYYFTSLLFVNEADNISV